jgi:hypothetical protein
VIESTEPSRSEAGLPAACQRLTELAALEADWDSYGTDPPTNLAITTARQVLEAVAERLASAAGTDPAPYFIAPVPTGGVQLEWTGPASEIEVEIGPEGALGYLLVRREGDAETEQVEARVSPADVAHAVAGVLSFGAIPSPTTSHTPSSPAQTTSGRSAR